MKKEIEVQNVGFDHVRSVENDVFDVPENIISDFGLPPKKSEAINEKHTRGDEVQLNIE